MKKRKLNSRLSLSKQTISKMETSFIKGGTDGTTTIDPDCNSGIDLCVFTAQTDCAEPSAICVNSIQATCTCC
ncbi:hypothetical protein GTQ40_13045 [Flavobacteriaceae bacterium R38]|nr:hypothetical protein [Flavobacteriaceae bacterium R38]